MRQPGAEVFDLGYQRYTGPREGRNRARWALFENGVRTLLGIGRGGKAKILPVLLFISAITPAVVFVVILAFIGDLAAAVEEGDFVPGPADYYGIVAVVLVLFGAIMAPELLGPDRRDNVLPLYLVRPLTTLDYLVVRLLAFAVIALALVYSGQAVLFAGQAFTSEEPLQYLRDNWADIPRILLVGAVISLFISVATLAVSAYVVRRAVAAAVIIGAYIVIGGVVDGLTFAENCTNQDASFGESPFMEGQDCDYIIGDFAPYVGLLQPGGVTDNINVLVFDLEPQSPSGLAVSELPDLTPVAAYLVWVIVPAALLWNRYRRIRL